MSCQIVIKNRSTKFHVNPYNGSRADTRGKMDGQTEG
jgi:hypothetical protein